MVKTSQIITRKTCYVSERKVGLIFQYAALFDSLTVLQNVGFSLYEERIKKDSEIREIVIETLRLVKLGDILDKMRRSFPAVCENESVWRAPSFRNPKYCCMTSRRRSLDPVTSDAP
jgi:phospholipid/cholesterol/gamma-HCH transport system ATP-binding protein